MENWMIMRRVLSTSGEMDGSRRGMKGEERKGEQSNGQSQEGRQVMEDEQVPVEMTGWIKAPVKLDCTGKKLDPCIVGDRCLLPLLSRDSTA